MPLRNATSVQIERDAPTGQGIGRVAIAPSGTADVYMLADSGDAAWLEDEGSDVFSLDDAVANRDRGIYRVGSTDICDL